MSDDTFRTSSDGAGSEGGNDPLGILGWLIGGKYKIRAYIGGGGFGEVYDGYNVNLPEQRLVIKFFKRVQSRDKFAKEAKILCLLDHPNILRIIDYLPDEGALVVPFIDGKDGGHILRESGPLPEKLFLRLARAMTDALSYAHEKKIAHRDLKPGNMLIDKNEHFYLIDFGIAKEMGGSATKTAYVALTPLFAAPERQSGDRDYNPFLSDIYEMGVTLFNFATNEMPYRNPGNPNPGEWGGMATKSMSPQLRRILRKATHPDPTQRFQTAAELAKEFRNLEQAYGGGKSKSKFLAIAAVVVVLAVAAFAVKQYMGGSSPTETGTKPDIAKSAVNQTAASPPVVKPAPVDTQKTASQTTPTVKAEDKKPATTTPAAAKTESAKAEPSAAQVQLPSLLIHIIPQYDVTLRVDGKETSPDRKVEVQPGEHIVTIVSPGFPILVDTVNITVDRSNEYNLNTRFANAPTLTFRVGIIPPDIPNGTLQIMFNGLKHQYQNDELPVLNLKKKAGRWQIRFDILGKDAYRIDSVITFPYGGGPRVILKGNSGTIDFGAREWQGIESVDMVSYWTNR